MAESFERADVEERGTQGRLERLPRLNLESQQDFLTGFRTWVNEDFAPIARKRSQAILEAKGIDPKADLPLEQVLDLIADDPVIAARAATWMSCQTLSWQSLVDEFHTHADDYLAEMEVADQSGPGSLELNPDMELPSYTTHEIHVQPGGYVGDPFAGHIYHYGTNNFYTDRNHQDLLHIRYAAASPEPQDGRVKRVLDLGCSCGQMTVALKERFPDAEVWGIDVGGPMVRYAHMRAVDMNVDVHFAQRLAEDTRFPDNHFDIVTSYILHHEVSGEASKEIIREAFRILRPGGVFFPIDIYTGSLRPPVSAIDKFIEWVSHRWNHEVWRIEYADVDFPDEMRRAGFDVNEKGPRAFIGNTNLLGTKPS